MNGNEGREKWGMTLNKDFQQELNQGCCNSLLAPQPLGQQGTLSFKQAEFSMFFFAAVGLYNIWSDYADLFI